MTHGGDSYCVVWVESLCVGFGVGYVNVYLNARGGLWLTRVALARCGGSRWARRFGAMRQWERGWERGVSVCLFVTFCHCSKYAFIVVRCQRLGGVGFLLTALLGFCETVFGPFGRHSYNWAARTCLFLVRKRSGLACVVLNLFPSFLFFLPRFLFFGC